MTVIKMIEHKGTKEKPCGYRWVYEGMKKTGITCPRCHGKFDLTEKDRRILKKITLMNRERG